MCGMEFWVEILMGYCGGESLCGNIGGGYVLGVMCVSANGWGVWWEVHSI